LLRYPGQRWQRLGLKSFGVGVLHRSVFANLAVSRLSINSLATGCDFASLEFRRRTRHTHYSVFRNKTSSFRMEGLS
jgi:hypothetical protein